MHDEHNYRRNTMGLNSPVAFLSHTFTETQGKWSTPEQEAYRVEYIML